MARRLGIIAALLSILPACPSAEATALPAAPARTAVHRGRHFHRRARRRRRRLRHHHHRLRRHSAIVSGCANVDLTPTPANAEAVRGAVVCLVNRERTSRGEPALRVDPDLLQAAQGHTASMAERNYFDHIGPGGDTPLSRIRATGYLNDARLGYAIGENIAWGTGYLGTPRSIVASWMGSAPHRENILDPDFRDTGVGIAARTPAGPGGLYTQDFGVAFR